MGFVFEFKNKTNKQSTALSTVMHEDKAELMLRDRKKELEMSIQRIMEQDSSIN
jgi:hypothetical protein